MNCARCKERIGKGYDRPVAHLNRKEAKT